ncbi:MAG: hypothetical protein ACSLE5_13535 [Porticoccaceae bacterium]
MFFEGIGFERLARNSYLVGDGFEAAVIDPSRDVGRYIDRAMAHHVRISVIFETHRNEDYISGTRELAKRTAATLARPEPRLHGSLRAYDPQRTAV